MGIVESWTNFERHNVGTNGARELLCNEKADVYNGFYPSSDWIPYE